MRVMLSLLILALADYNPQIDRTEFQATVDNPFYPFAPGTTWKYVEKSGGATSTSSITVTHDTKVVMG
jgi:hypothetical protein